MAKILLVEDDVQVAEGILKFLESERHQVEHCANGSYGFEMITTYSYELAVLDWNLPGLSGPDICRQYRARGGTAPILLLTARADVNDKVTGLECGADDYLTKPFDIRELSARVKALLRRPASLTGNVLSAGQLSLDLGARRLTKNDVEIHLGPKEFALMELFMKNPGHAFSTNAILDRVWASDSDATAESLRTFIKRLRKKIDEPDSEDSCIRNLPGQGYRLDV